MLLAVSEVKNEVMSKQGTKTAQSKQLSSSKRGFFSRPAGDCSPSKAFRPAGSGWAHAVEPVWVSCHLGSPALLERRVKQEGHRQ